MSARYKRTAAEKGLTRISARDGGEGVSAAVQGPNAAWRYVVRIWWELQPAGVGTLKQSPDSGWNRND